MVEVVFDTFPGRVFPARVESVGWGVTSDSTQGAGLPTIRNDTGWIRVPQRFPVRVVFDEKPPRGVRHGSQANVVVYTGDNPVMNALGGVLASLAFAVVEMRPMLLNLFLVVHLIGLLIGGGAAADPKAGKAYAGALTTFLPHLGIGISPLPASTPERGHRPLVHGLDVRVPVTCPAGHAAAAVDCVHVRTPLRCSPLPAGQIHAPPRSALSVLERRIQEGDRESWLAGWKGRSRSSPAPDRSVRAGAMAGQPPSSSRVKAPRCSAWTGTLPP
jgi:hypothetical protein